MTSLQNLLGPASSPGNSRPSSSGEGANSSGITSSADTGSRSRSRSASASASGTRSTQAPPLSEPMHERAPLTARPKSPLALPSFSSWTTGASGAAPDAMTLQVLSKGASPSHSSLSATEASPRWSPDSSRSANGLSSTNTHHRADSAHPQSLRDASPRSTIGHSEFRQSPSTEGNLTHPMTTTPHSLHQQSSSRTSDNLHASTNSMTPSAKAGNICFICRTTQTPLWRRDQDGNPICNACGLYLKSRAAPRPAGAGSAETHGGDSSRSSTGSIASNASRPAVGSPSTQASMIRAPPSPRATGSRPSDDFGVASPSFPHSDHSVPGKSSRSSAVKTPSSSARVADSSASTTAAHDPSSGSCPGGGVCNGSGGQSCCQGCPAFNNRVMHLSKSATSSASAQDHTTSANQGDESSINGVESSGEVTAMECFNCQTQTTPLWRRDGEGRVACNACGVNEGREDAESPRATTSQVVRQLRECASFAAGLADQRHGDQSPGFPFDLVLLLLADAFGFVLHPTSTLQGNVDQMRLTFLSRSLQFGPLPSHWCAPSSPNCRISTFAVYDQSGLYYKLHGTQRPVLLKKTTIKRRRRVPIPNRVGVMADIVSVDGDRQPVKETSTPPAPKRRKTTKKQPRLSSPNTVNGETSFGSGVSEDGSDTATSVAIAANSPPGHSLPDLVAAASFLAPPTSDRAETATPSPSTSTIPLAAHPAAPLTSHLHAYAHHTHKHSYAHAHSHTIAHPHHHHLAPARPHTHTHSHAPALDTPLHTLSLRDLMAFQESLQADLQASREQANRLELYFSRGEQLLDAVRTSVKDKERAVGRNGPAGEEGSSQREGTSTDKGENTNRVTSSTFRTAEQDLEDLFGDLPNMEAVPLPPRIKKGKTTTNTPLQGSGNTQGAIGDAAAAGP